jgi:hypothetical protein
MNKKRGRKKDSGVLSGIRPDQTYDQIIIRLSFGSTEWPMVMLQNLIKNGSVPRDVRLSPDTPFWDTLCVEFEHAVLASDADWFERQANAIKKEKVEWSRLHRFRVKVVFRLEQLDVERKADPEFVDLEDLSKRTPAGKRTDATASKIWKAVVADACAEPKLQPLIDKEVADAAATAERLGRRLQDNKKRQIIEQVVAEIHGFRTKELAMDEIRELAERLGFKLKKQARRVSEMSAQKKNKIIQACKEERDALVKALDDLLSLVQNGLKVIDAHAGDASDADYQKKIEALRARAQQHLQWGQEQRKALGQLSLLLR